MKEAIPLAWIMLITHFHISNLLLHIPYVLLPLWHFTRFHKLSELTHMLIAMVSLASYQSLEESPNHK